MSPTHESIHQLEPSNLLEPLDFADQHVNPELGARLDPGAASRRSTIPAESAKPSGRRISSWPFRAALILAGAVACFGAGAAVSHLATVTSVAGLKLSRTDASAIPPSAPVAPTRLEQTKPAEAKPAEAKLNETASETASTEPSHGAGPAANAAASTGGASPAGTPRQWTDPVPATRDAALEPSGPPIAAKPPGVTDSRRGDTRAYGRVDDRSQASRESRRAARRGTADQQPADGNAPSANYSERRRDRDSKRASIWRDRYDDRTRGDDRDGVDKALREDGRATGWESRADERELSRSPREEGRTTGRGPREDERVTGRSPRDEGPVTPPRGGEGFFGMLSPYRW
jgi:hypothetical protein